MKDDPLWIDVTALFTAGRRGYRRAGRTPDTRTGFAEYVDRLHRAAQRLDATSTSREITGADKTVDVVVDIFNRVNSGGTKLSKGDLALARICSSGREARPTMREHLDRWRLDGYCSSSPTGCCATSTRSPPAGALLRPGERLR